MNGSKQLCAAFIFLWPQLNIHKNMREPDELVSVLCRLYYCTSSSLSTFRVECDNIGKIQIAILYSLWIILTLWRYKRVTNHMLNIFYFLRSLWPEKLIDIEIPLGRITVAPSTLLLYSSFASSCTMARNNSSRSQSTTEVNKQL